MMNMRNIINTNNKHTHKEANNTKNTNTDDGEKHNKRGNINNTKNMKKGTPQTNKKKDANNK